MAASWKPDRPTSKGATAYHDAVIHTSWHKKNILWLVKIAGKHIKDNDIVVDFGAGTGASAFYLLKLIPGHFKLLLVDNSPSWLGKAYAELSHHPNVTFSIIEKVNNRYALLHETIGEERVDHILSANTVHLIPDIEDVYKGIYKALKKGGTFIFQSGNISRYGRKKGLLMIDNTVKSIHSLALDIIRNDNTFAKYRTGLDKKIEREVSQRKRVFPDPRPIAYYLKLLKSSGFHNIKVSSKPIRVKYNDWLAFLRVRRLQAGILPEVGGREPSAQEEQDRDTLIAAASRELFKQLTKKNPLANAKRFTAEWIYVKAEK